MENSKLEDTFIYYLEIKTGWQFQYIKQNHYIEGKYTLIGPYEERKLMTRKKFPFISKNLLCKFNTEKLSVYNIIECVFEVAKEIEEFENNAN